MAPKKKPLDPLQRVIPKNPRFAGVRGVVDSGATVTKVEQITTREFLKRRDEQYGRVKASQLYGLLIEYCDAGGMGAIAEGEGEGAEEGVAAARPTTLGGEPCEFVPTASEKPYLIVDVREPEEFAVCHITEALCMPARVLSRDSIAPEIYRFRNRKDAMIILYEAEERQSAAVAVKLFERGCDNVFIITGGLKSVGNKYPELLDGELPKELVGKAPKSTGAPSSARSVVSAATGAPSTARSVATTSSAWK